MHEIKATEYEQQKRKGCQGKIFKTCKLEISAVKKIEVTEQKY